MQEYTNVLQDTAGNVQAGVVVTVKDGGTSNVSTIYSDNGSTVIPNVTTDSNGTFSFWAADGTYDLYQGATKILSGVLLFDPYAANTADTANVFRVASATVELKAPTSAPGAPAAGDIWEASGLLTHGASSRVVCDLAGDQTLSGNKTFSAPIISTVSTGTAPFTVASTTKVTNLQADTAAALATGSTVTLAQLPAGTANQVLGTNSGATAVEQKSLATGTSGTDFAIAHTSGTITFNLPTADGTHRGALAAADWTTFNSGSITLARLPFGTANQILGTNAGGSAIEQKSLAVGTSGSDFAIVHTANTVTFDLPDAGASARGAVTTGTQTFAGAKTTTGTLTPSGGLVVTGRSAYSTIPISTNSQGTSVSPVAGTLYYAELFIPRNITLTGVAILNVTTVGTNKRIVGLHTSAGGAAVANSDLAGTLSAGATWQLIPFTGTYAAVGPARYWIVVQADGNTDPLKMIAANTYIDVLTKSAAGAFGTLSSLTVPTTFTASVGAVAYVYA